MLFVEIQFNPIGNLSNGFRRLTLDLSWFCRPTWSHFKKHANKNAWDVITPVLIYTDFGFIKRWLLYQSIHNTSASVDFTDHRHLGSGHLILPPFGAQISVFWHWNKYHSFPKAQETGQQWVEHCHGCHLLRFQGTLIFVSNRTNMTWSESQY